MKLTKSKLKQLIREEIDWHDPEKGYETVADRKFAERPPDVEGAGADRQLVYMMENLGTLDNVAQVLELVAGDIPEFMQIFQNRYDQLISR
jgi:hypothetical protein